MPKNSTKDNGSDGFHASDPDSVRENDRPHGEEPTSAAAMPGTEAEDPQLQLLRSARLAALDLAEDAKAEKERADELVSSLRAEITSRKRVESALRESEAQLRAIYNGTREYLGLVSPDGTVLRTNRASLEFAGSSMASVIGKPLWDAPWFAYTPGMPGKIRRGFEIALKGAFFRSEITLARPDGRELTFDFSLHPIKNEAGEVTMVVPEGYDITEIRRAEHALRRSEERYRGIINQAVAGVAETDLSGRFLAANDRFCEMLGISHEELLERSILDITHPGDHETNLAKLADLLAEGKAFEIEKRYIRADGTPVWVLNSVYAICDENNQPQSIAAIVIDISERKAVERRLRRSEIMMSTLVEAAPFGIYFIDSKFRLMSVNRGARAVFSGVEPLIGRDFAEIMRILWKEPFATNAIEHFRHTLETGESYVSPPVTEARANADAVESYDWQVHRIILPDGTFGVVCYFYDLSTQKQLEAKVRRAAAINAFRVRLTDALLPVSDPVETQVAASKVLGEQIGADRVAYFEVKDGYYVVETDYVAGVKNIRDRHPVSDFGPELIAAYERGEVVVWDDIEDCGKLSEAEKVSYRRLDVAAHIAVPLRKDGRLVAGLAVHSATPREWTAEEVDLARETAERTWAAVERARAEAAASEFDQRLRLLMESATDYSIFTTDPAGIINSWNTGSARIYGYSENEIIGKNVEILFTPEDRAMGMHVREQTIATEHGRAMDERWHLRKDGTRFFASGVTQPLGDDATHGFVKIARDMTERLRAERAQMEKELLRKLVGAQEDERKRIARDLHDELGQQLTALRINLDRIQKEADGTLAQQLSKVQRIAQSIDHGVDFLAWELRPAALDDLGLPAALEKYVSEWSHYSRVNGRLKVSTVKNRRFTTEIETALYRIVQEALNNVHKHANAANAEITVQLRGKNLVLLIDDDGQGFLPDDPEIKRKGIGLIGMQERVQIVGGTMEIESELGRGTTIFIKVPVEQG